MEPSLALLLQVRDPCAAAGIALAATGTGLGLGHGGACSAHHKGQIPAAPGGLA